MTESRLTLKHPAGFFAAGCEMQDALGLLSDGAFKIFVYVLPERRPAQRAVTLPHGGTGPRHRPQHALR